MSRFNSSPACCVALIIALTLIIAIKIDNIKRIENIDMSANGIMSLMVKSI